MTEPFDFSQFRMQINAPWQEFTKFHTNWAIATEDLCRQCLHLPEPRLTPIFLAYLATPSALADCLPILWLTGASGSGKSVASKFALFTRHNRSPYSSTSTYAAIRNDLNNLKYFQGRETNLLLSWDDFDSHVFAEQAGIFRMFKSGCDRSTSIIRLSGEKTGENISFNAFANKVLSSVKPIYLEARWSELHRRTMPVMMRKTDKNTLCVEEIDFSGLPALYAAQWDEKKCEHYVFVKKQIIKARPDNIPIDVWRIVIDVLTTSVVCQFYGGIDEAIREFVWYLSDYRANIKERDNFHDLLETYVTGKERQYLDAMFTINHRLDGTEVCLLSSRDILERSKEWYHDAKITVVPTPKVLEEYMSAIGWELTPRGFKRYA